MLSRLGSCRLQWAANKKREEFWKFNGGDVEAQEKGV